MIVGEGYEASIKVVYHLIDTLGFRFIRRFKATI